MKIHYWCDETWCLPEELGGFNHMSDDYLTVEVSDELEYEAIDKLVFELNRFINSNIRMQN